MPTTDRSAVAKKGAATRKARLAAAAAALAAQRAPVIEQARAMWRARCDAYQARHGDVGTCVLGAGIADDTGRTLVRAIDVCQAQGASVWEDSVEEVVAFLGSNGIPCHYNPGFMD